MMPRSRQNAEFWRYAIVAVFTNVRTLRVPYSLFHLLFDRWMASYTEIIWFISIYPFMPVHHKGIARSSRGQGAPMLDVIAHSLVVVEQNSSMTGSHRSNNVGYDLSRVLWDSFSFCAASSVIYIQKPSIQNNPSQSLSHHRLFPFKPYPQPSDTLHLLIP